MELEQKTVKDVILVGLTRPIRLFAEPIILLSCIYLAFEYALFYLFFVAYPIIFQGWLASNISLLSIRFLHQPHLLTKQRHLWHEHRSCCIALTTRFAILLHSFLPS